MKFTLRRRSEVLDESLSLHFMLPVIGENVFTIGIGLLISRIVSTISGSALAAIGLANNVMAVVFALFSMVTTGAAVLVARHIGAGNSKEAAETIEQTTLLTLVTTVTITLACIVSAGGLMQLLMPSADEAMQSEAVRYFRILMISLPFYVLHAVYSAICRSMGDSRTPLLAAAVMNLVQLGAAWLFIRGFRWEEIGAGLAYVVCRAAGTVFLALALLHDHRYFALCIRNVFRPQPVTCGRILRLGVPCGIEGFFLQMGYMLGNTMALALGALQGNVFQILTTLSAFATIPQAICANIALAAAGHLLGAKRYGDVRKAGGSVWWGGIVSQMALTGIVVLFAEPLAGLYSSDAAVVENSAAIMWILLFVNAAGISINAIDPQLRAGGDVRFVMAVTLSAVWLIRLPLTWLFCFHWELGVLGIFLANGISLWVRAGLGLARWFGKKWMYKKV